MVKVKSFEGKENSCEMKRAIWEESFSIDGFLPWNRFFPFSITFQVGKGKTFLSLLHVWDSDCVIGKFDFCLLLILSFLLVEKSSSIIQTLNQS